MFDVLGDDVVSLGGYSAFVDAIVFLVFGNFQPAA